MVVLHSNLLQLLELLFVTLICSLLRLVLDEPCRPQPYTRWCAQPYIDANNKMSSTCSQNHAPQDHPNRQALSCFAVTRLLSHADVTLYFSKHVPPLLRSSCLLPSCPPFCLPLSLPYFFSLPYPSISLYLPPFACSFLFVNCIFFLSPACLLLVLFLRLFRFRLSLCLISSFSLSVALSEKLSTPSTVLSTKRSSARLVTQSTHASFWLQRTWRNGPKCVTRKTALVQWCCAKMACRGFVCKNFGWAGLISMCWYANLKDRKRTFANFGCVKSLSLWRSANLPSAEFGCFQLLLLREHILKPLRRVGSV